MDRDGQIADLARRPERGTSCEITGGKRPCHVAQFDDGPRHRPREEKRDGRGNGEGKEPDDVDVVTRFANEGLRRGVSDARVEAVLDDAHNARHKDADDDQRSEQQALCEPQLGRAGVPRLDGLQLIAHRFQ